MDLLFVEVPKRSRKGFHTGGADLVELVAHIVQFVIVFFVQSDSGKYGGDGKGKGENDDGDRSAIDLFISCVSIFCVLPSSDEEKKMSNFA